MKKYDAKYFGIALGALATILYILSIVKMLNDGKDYSKFFVAFIPFFTSLNLINLLGGLIVSFLWGWVLGFFLIVVYNLFENKYSKISP